MLVRVTPDVALGDGASIEERFANTPRDYMIRGVFFEHHLRALGDSWRALEKDLIAPPEEGEYSAFAYYPQVDHARFAVAVAQKHFPALSIREGLRRVERGAASAFASSVVGRVITSFVSDPTTAFRLLPEIYGHIQKGGSFRYEPHPGGARIEVRDFAPWVDCSLIGSFEGMVGLFGRRPSMQVELLSDSDANFDIEWK